MIGERLAEIRKDHRDTQTSLAQHLNVSPMTVRSWEQEKSAPSHETLVKICKMYHISSDFLLGLSDADPLYSTYRRAQILSTEDNALLKEFETFLFWRNNQNNRNNQNK